MEYHIVCANPTCRAVKVVTRYDQRRRRFCSRSCGAKSSPITTLTREQRLAAAEAYRLAYSVGWKAGVRAERRRNGGTA